MAKYKCPTLGDCDKANAGEIFERAPGEDIKCPACNTTMEKIETGGPTGPGPKRPLGLIIGGIVAVAAVAGGGYFFMAKPGKSTETPVAAAPAEAAKPIPVSVPAPAANAGSGISPSDADTKALRQQGQEKLTSGDASGAEQASAKAAANEMIKLAIAKMAQGKLEDAEKDLAEARTRDPKQSLVYYNTAILRLKQSRPDDALKELEASFLAGFSYFEQMDQDTDLDGLRKNPRFAELVAKYRPAGK